MAKQLILFKPAFTPGTANNGTVDFTNYEGFNLNRLYAIINITRNAILYAPGAANYGRSVANIGLNQPQPTYPIVTLSVDTSTHSSTDILEVFYDVPPGAVESNTAMERGGMLEAGYILKGQILTELRVMNMLLQQGLLSGINGNEGLQDLDELRNDQTRPVVLLTNSGVGGP